MLAGYTTASVVQHAKKGKSAFDTFVTTLIQARNALHHPAQISNSTMHWTMLIKQLHGSVHVWK